MTKPRKPTSFRLEDVEVVETPLPPPAIATDAAQLPATVRALPALERGWRWGSILLAAVGGLVGLASAMWLHDLVREMMARNQIAHDDLVSILFTATDDLQSEFPATAARALGLGDVPLICARELDIVHGMKRTIRVMMHFYGDTPRADLHHIYLEGARSLRDDLPA